MQCHRASLVAVAALFAGCAALPPEIPEFSDCRTRYLQLDERAEVAGVRDAGARRVAGFPYLRVDRFLASFADEVGEEAAFEAWVGHMRRLDLETRAAEMRNSGQRDPVANAIDWLDRCGKAWAARDLADAERRRELREAARVPDDYSLAARVLGLYPVAVPFLNMGISSFNAEVRKDYATPYAELRPAGPLVLWSPEASGGVAAAEVASWLESRDALGVPALSKAQWQELAATHRPHWLVETAGEHDRPGAPALARGVPGVDTTRPVTYTLSSFTRYGGKVLTQLVYVVWFAERPAEGLVDSYAGALDGIVWRVTLDTDGAPLLYDTIHPCGCYHYYYPAKPLALRQRASFWQEPVLLPQAAPPAPFAVRLASGTHYVRRLVPLDEVQAGERRSYETAPYRELLTLPDGRGGTRSLFGEDGLVAGTERLERFWLWPAGVDNPGAMRQWGRHATSFVGRSHFDDPEMLDRLFEGGALLP